MKSLTYAFPCLSANVRATVNPTTYCLLTTLIFSASSVSAQASTDDGAQIQAANKKLERILVQAQKTSQNLQDVPVAVTALSGQDMADTVSRDMFDLQNYVPAFGAFQNQSVTNSGFSIRGIGTASQNFGFESSVGLYVDGVYRSRQNALISDLVDIESIEVLRGPQGTLFGKNTAAGAMTVSTVAPSHGERNGFAEAIIGNDNLVRLSAGSSFSLIDDILAMRVSGFSSQGDGFITDEARGQTLNNRNRSAVKAQLFYTPTENVSVRLIADYGELDERCCGALTFQNNIQANDIAGKFGTDALLLQPPFNATIYGRDDFYNYKTSLSQTPLSKMKDKGLSVQVDVALNKAWDFVSISAYRAFDSLDTVDTDFSDADLLTATNDARQQSFSQEVRLHYSSDDIRGLIGAYFYSQNLDLTFDTTTQNDFSVFFNAAAPDLLPLANAINELSAITSGFIAPAAVPAPSGTAFVHSANQEQDSIAVFSQFDWLLNRNFTLTTGLRYTREEKSIDGAYDERGPGIDGLSQNPAQWPNIERAVQGLQDISAALTTGQAPSAESLNAIAPFQQAGWGYFFLGSAAVMPRPDLNEQLDDSQLTGTVKLAYHPNDNTLTYASLATGYKAGGTNTDRILPSLSPLFDAEKSRSAEIGIKHDFEEYGVRVNAAAHYTQISDFQAATFTGTGFNLQNAGDIIVKGVELEATWLVTENTELHAVASRTLANFDEFERGTCWVAYTWHTGIDDPGRANPSDPFCARDGDRVGFEPQNSLSLMLNHYFEVGNYPASASIDYQYTGDVFLDDANDPYKYSDDFSLFNIRLSFTIPQWDSEVIAWSRNVFDEEYVARSGFDVPVQTGKVMAYPGAPRSFGVTFRKSF
ncbi:TonB-dependent receptor [Alteromonas macleodii]|uniref:Outer membrane receptor protein n=1 Tax=Alteromonas macleodii TaxID=28108 RepID=A0A6T9XZU1_ALTMA|nr:TonB-dependent receptor [Alteromonas macleodii]CAB9494280.1 Outer membrane receptor protein [Alteromonas macleodii]